MRWFCISLIVCCGVARAEIIDRVAVVVETTPILDSDIQRDIRVTSFLNSKPPDFSLSSRKASASRLIDQNLIRDQIRAGSYPEAQNSQVDALLSQIQQHRFGSESDYRVTLQHYGITEAEIKDSLLWESTVLAFIDARFRPEVTISDQDIRDYTRSHQSANRTDAEVRELMTGNRVNQLLEDWLADARKNARIQYLEESLQ